MGILLKPLLIDICTLLSLLSPGNVLVLYDLGVHSPYFIGLLMSDLLKVHILVRKAIYIKTQKLEDIYEVIF